MNELKNIFHTLADINRLRIIQALSVSRKPVGELVESTGLSQPLVSHHLRVLKQNNIVSTTRKGPFVFYTINDTRTLEAIDLFVDIFLKHTVEGELKFSPEESLKEKEI